MSQALVVLVLGCRRRDLANPVSYLNVEGQSGSNPSGCREVVDAMLPGKASKLQFIRNRTRNRHRWSGREYQGA